MNKGKKQKIIKFKKINQIFIIKKFQNINNNKIIKN